jgi:hypothetical protein
MKLLIAASIITAGIGTSVAAQSPQTACGSIADAMTLSAVRLQGLYQTIDSTSFAEASLKFTGEERAAMEELMRAKAELMPKMRKYLTALQDTAYAMQKCARP